MNFLGSSKSKTVKTTPLVSREVSVLAHVWPTDRPYYKDLRFHFHGGSASSEAQIIYKLLSSYSKETTLNPDNFHIKSIIEAALVSMIQRKLDDLGFNIKWISIKL
jgi:hypothetical protein